MLGRVPSEAVLKCSVRSSGLGMRWDVELGGWAAPDLEMYPVAREQPWLQWVMWGWTGQIQPLPMGPPWGGLLGNVILQNHSNETSLGERSLSI